MPMVGRLGAGALVRRKLCAGACSNPWRSPMRLFMWCDNETISPDAARALCLSGATHTNSSSVSKEDGSKVSSRK